MSNSFSGEGRLSNYIANGGKENFTHGTLTSNFNFATPASGSFTSFNTASQTEKTLFVPFLGQSNGEHMSIVYDPYQPGATANDTSGATILTSTLSSLTGSNVITSTTRTTNFAVGGSKVNGNGFYQNHNYVWWYPEQNQPGRVLIQAQQDLSQWLTEQGAQPEDEIALVWSQGESDVGDVSSQNPEYREQYKQSTLAIFDYLRNNLGYQNITFYLVPTGRLQAEGAANAGLNPQEIASMNQGVAVIRDVQTEIATQRDDVHLAPDYADLNMVYEEGQIYGGSYDQDYSRWSTDFWHLGHDGLKVNGDRLAQYIAVDQGEHHLISFTDSFGNPSESISLSRAGILDIDISSNPSVEVIRGTDNPDVIVGSLAADEITGGRGNDVLVGSEGEDTLTGGAGRDVFFYDSLVDSNLETSYDRILDFDFSRDYLDISEPLRLAGYTGNDPVADGYVVVNAASANSLAILFDPDGMGRQNADTLAILENVDSPGWQENLNTNLVIMPTEY